MRKREKERVRLRGCGFLKTKLLWMILLGKELREKRSFYLSKVNRHRSRCTAQHGRFNDEARESELKFKLRNVLLVRIPFYKLFREAFERQTIEKFDGVRNNERRMKKKREREGKEYVSQTRGNKMAAVVLKNDAAALTRDLVTPKDGRRKKREERSREKREEPRVRPRNSVRRLSSLLSSTIATESPSVKRSRDVS